MLKTIYKLLFILAVFFSNHKVVNGQQGKKPMISIKDAVDAAVKNYPSILVRQQQINLGKAKVEDVKHAYLPTILAADQISFGSDNSNSGSYFSLGGAFPSVSGGNRTANKFDIAGGNIAAVTAFWEIYNFGAYDAATNEALASLQVDETGLSREKYVLTSYVIQNYFDLAKYIDLLTLQLKNIDRAETLKNVVKSYVINGLRPGVDTSIADAELSKARLIYLDLYKNLLLTRSQIATITGIDTSSIVTDSNITSKIKNYVAQTFTNDTNSLNQHPLIQYYDAILNDNLAQSELIRKSYMPKVFLQASTWLRGSSISAPDNFDSNPFSGLIYSRGNYLIGAGITYDLMSKKKRDYKLDVQKYRTEIAKASIVEQKTILNNYLNQANINLEAANNSLKEIPIQYKSANDAYQQKLALYNSGLATIVDLTNALYLLNRAETDAVFIQSEVWKATIQKVYGENRVQQFLEYFK